MLARACFVLGLLVALPLVTGVPAHSDGRLVVTHGAVIVAEDHGAAWQAGSILEDGAHCAADRSTNEPRWRAAGRFVVRHGPAQWRGERSMLFASGETLHVERYTAAGATFALCDHALITARAGAEQAAAERAAGFAALPNGPVAGSVTLGPGPLNGPTPAWRFDGEGTWRTDGAAWRLSAQGTLTHAVTGLRLTDVQAIAASAVATGSSIVVRT